MSEKDPRYLVESPVPTWTELLNSRFGRAMDGYREICCFSAASKLGLFDILKDPMTPEQVAEKLGTDSPLLKPCMEILAEMGLLVRDGDEYVCGQAAKTFFVSSSPYFQKERMKTVVTRLRRWEDLGDNIMNVWKEGKHEIDYVPWITGIAENAMSGDIQETIGILKETVDLSECRSLMDIGGGHGLYSIAFETAYPGMHCTVFDQPPVTPVTKSNSEAYGVDIGIQTGDYYKDKVLGTYDVVFASYNRACTDPELVPMLADLINPGGYLIIRHSQPFEGRPYDFIEWNNFPKQEGFKRTPFEDYVKCAEEHGLVKTDVRPLAVRSEMVIFRKDKAQ